MDQVAARARVSKSSLYLRWPNKVALVADALQHRARAVPEVPDTGSLPRADSDVELLAGLPLSLLQNWRLEHHGQPDDVVVERIVRQFYTPRPPR